MSYQHYYEKITVQTIKAIHLCKSITKSYKIYNKLIHQHNIIHKVYVYRSGHCWTHILKVKISVLQYWPFYQQKSILSKFRERKMLSLK